MHRLRDDTVGARRLRPAVAYRAFPDLQAVDRFALDKVILRD
jgi:hypothetical protein